MRYLVAAALLLAIHVGSLDAQHTGQRGAGVFVGGHAMHVQQPAEGAALGVVLGYH